VKANPPPFLQPRCNTTDKWRDWAALVSLLYVAAGVSCCFLLPLLLVLLLLLLLGLCCNGDV